MLSALLNGKNSKPQTEMKWKYHSQNQFSFVYRIINRQIILICCKPQHHKVSTSNKSTAWGNVCSRFHCSRHALRQTTKDTKFAEKHRTKSGYDTCKTVIPGDYFHHVELPYINRCDSEMSDARVDLYKPRSDMSLHGKQSTELSRSVNNFPSLEKINIY